MDLECLGGWVKHRAWGKSQDHCHVADEYWPMSRERVMAGTKKSGPRGDLGGTGRWDCWESVAA